MKVALLKVELTDPRSTHDVDPGSVLQDTVVLDIDGVARSFAVFTHANVLPGLGASMVNGEFSLEELLRFEPSALSALYSMVGQVRRGHKLQLPVELVGQGQPTEFADASS